MMPYALNRGYNIGQRLIDELLAKCNLGAVSCPPGRLASSRESAACTSATALPRNRLLNL